MPNKKSKSEFDKLYEKVSANMTVVDHLPDLSNHPFFVQKEKEAREFIKKHGLPKGYEEIEKQIT